jgi:hypothetical protein
MGSATMTLRSTTHVTLARLGPHLRPRMSQLALDAWLYAGAAIFAFLLWYFSNLSPHRDWGRLSIPGYLVCAVAAGVLAVVKPARELLCRCVVAGIAFVLVALMPLGVMVRERAADGHELHVLPEVAVIERAGHRIAHGLDPYVAYVHGGHLFGAVAGVPRYEAFYPYFSAMTAFGLPSAVHGFGWLGDARIWMTLVTLGLVALGLWLIRAPGDRSLRTVQWLLILPTGALFVAGGGDDLPVLAVCFVAIAATLRRRPLAAGVAFGIAMAMKLTAWPLALLTLFVVRDAKGRRAAGRASAIMAAIVAVFVIPFAIWDPRTFFANTIEFPLGLSGVDSPAASPLPGHIIVSVFPATHRILLVVLVLIGLPFLGWWLWRRPPTDVAGVCRLTAVIAIVVMCSAPATRIGYVVYPVNLLVWSWMLTTPAAAAPSGGDAAGSLGAESPGSPGVRQSSSEAW